MSLPPPDDLADLADILAFYLEAGVDVAVGEAPVDRFAESAAEQAKGRTATRTAAEPTAPVSPTGAPGPAGAAAPTAPNRPVAAPSFKQSPASRSNGMSPAAKSPAAMSPAPAGASALVTHPPDEAVMSAREAARNAESLDALRAILDGFEGCALKRTATRLVFADGNPQAKVMFVGEAPGRDEDQQGLPFVGRSGRLLDLMMAAIGLDRTSAYIANVIPWRPPGNRTPTPQETAVCLPFIKRQIELADPDILVCLGGPSAQALLATTEGITRLRGRFMDYESGTRTIRAIATFHPAYLLRTPLGKRLAWRDMLAVEAALKGA
ncbi:uracil-DNA glycosylase [Xanthobacter autotrophicus]|uniref:uracil-DNA glycosylase n=1 Tax=Xanthobacter autotrophicus TaxID=280 RepID=UPI0024A6C260|nr:uracil-DNA glycosylase [Xanthobacter autotrophicus]MDI4656741.1 uracil-DNA glycosylase [Xanthobacter autotrophicus]